MTNAVVDRMVFDKADLTGVQFVNAVITGARASEGWRFCCLRLPAGARAAAPVG